MRHPIFHWMAAALGSMTLAAVLPAAETNTAPAKPPMPPPVAMVWAKHGHLSPVQYFRSLLGMTAAEREKALAQRTPASRQAILAKVREYEAMPRAVREARLCQTELHWELSGLMRLNPTERKARLGEVSPLYRPMVEGLLRQWDSLPVNTQKAFLEKQNFIGLYLRMEGVAAGQAAASGPLTEAERKALEESAQRFNQLPPAQRAQFINSFDKFTAMPAEERAQFVNNAVRWETMTSYERQLWRQLVRQLPPMPPLPKELPSLPNRVRHALPPLPSNVTAPVVIALSTNVLR